MTSEEKARLVEQFVNAMKTTFPNHTPEDVIQYQNKAETALAITSDVASSPISRTNMVKFIGALLTNKVKPRDLKRLLQDWERRSNIGGGDRIDGVSVLVNAIMDIYSDRQIQSGALFDKFAPAQTCWDLFCLFPLA